MNLLWVPALIRHQHLRGYKAGTLLLETTPDLGLILNRDYNQDPEIKDLKRRGFVNQRSTLPLP